MVCLTTGFLENIHKNILVTPGAKPSCLCKTPCFMN